MPKGWNQQRGGFDNGPPRHGGRGKPNNRGHEHGRGGPPTHSSTPFVSASQQLFGSSASATVEVFEFNNMPSLDALNGQKPIFRGRGRGRGRATRATFRGGPPLPVNSHSHPVFVPQAANGNHNTRRGRVRSPLPLYDADYLDPYAHPNHSPSPASRSKGGGLGFGNSSGPNSKVAGNGGGRWDPATRLLLKPIKFVRAKERLFETDPDELLQAHELKPHPSDDLDPQIEIIEGIVAHNGQPPNEVSPSLDDGEETIIEMAARVETKVTKKGTAANEIESGIEGVANGLLAARANIGTISAAVPVLRPETELRVENSELFYFHSTPQVLPETSSSILFDRVTGPAIERSHTEDQEVDEIILYPSKTRRSTVPPPPPVVPPVVVHEDAIKAPTPPSDTPINIPTSFSVGNPSARSTFVPMRMRKEAKRMRRIERNKRKAEKVKFFDHEEMVITGDAEEFVSGSPRVGDSDLEWGSDGPPQAVKDGVFVENAKTSESDGGGMDVDDGLDEAALARFAMSVANPQHLGIHDLEGAEESDDEGGEVVGSGVDGSDSSGSESSEDSDEWTDEDEENQTPDMQWQSKLAKMREKVKGKQRATAADRDEDYLAYLEELLDDNADILEGRDRKERKSLFRAIQNGNFDDMPASGRYRKMKDVPVDLQDQWERDRLKKAERKRLRKEQREQGLLTKKTKKKDRVNGESPLESIEGIMRDLVFDISRKSVTLPPLPTEIREKVHRMALAFSLKSKSEGPKNKGRKAMVISRSGKTGTWINEFKVNKILKRPQTEGGRGGGHSKVAEGEVIGHKAAKISQDNVGYRLLAQMGWSEGEKIGLEGKGIDAPITAVMKKSKLGLGATR